MNLYTELLSILSVGSKQPGSLLYKGEDERQFLLDFLLREAMEVEESSTHKEPSLSQKATSGQLSIESINMHIEKCQLCPDIKERKKSFGSGVNSVMVILNAPALMTSYERNELKQESIVLLKKIIAASNLKLEECYITNLIKCESARSDFKPSSSFANCNTFIEEEIKLINPYIILVMGDLTPLRKLRKKNKDANWFEIPHPITMIKNPDLKREAWATLQHAMRVLAERADS